MMFRATLVLAVCWLLFAAAMMSNARAQDVTLRVTQAELALLGDALGAMPFAKVAPLMNKLQSQVIEQQKARDANGNSVEKKK